MSWFIYDGDKDRVSGPYPSEQAARDSESGDPAALRVVEADDMNAACLKLAGVTSWDNYDGSW